MIERNRLPGDVRQEIEEKRMRIHEDHRLQRRAACLLIWPAVAVLLAALVLAPAGCGGNSQAGEESGAGTPNGAASGELPRNVRVVTLEPIDLEQSLVISGPAAPVRGTDVAAEEGGRVAEIPHDKGARVKADDVLVLLDRSLLEAEMRAAQADEELASYNADRTRQLFEANSVSQIELLDVETRERQAEAAADAARIRYERAAVKAPFGGQVVSRYVELGQTVAPGMPVARIVDPYVLELQGWVTEQEVRGVHEGQAAEILFEGLDGPMTGRVHWVGFEAEPANGKFPVEIRVDNPDLALRPGVIGRARVLKASHESVLAVPRDAVLLAAGTASVYVVESGRAALREVDLGPGQGVMVIVRRGLQRGDQVVVRGHRDLRAGAAVAVQEVAEAPDGSVAGDPEIVIRDSARQAKNDREAGR